MVYRTSYFKKSIYVVMVGLRLSLRLGWCRPHPPVPRLWNETTCTSPEQDWSTFTNTRKKKRWNQRECEVTLVHARNEFGEKNLKCFCVKEMYALDIKIKQEFKMSVA